MPITFAVAPVAPTQPPKASTRFRGPKDLLNEQVMRLNNPEYWGDQMPTTSVEMLQTSFTTKDFSSLDIRSKRNGFVQTVTQAYNGHHHLIMRPDDVWIAILGQFNIYVNKNAKELRSHFVQHEDKKKLIVVMPGDRHDVNFGDLAMQMTQKIQENIVNPELRDWIIPNFTTTTHNDTVVCAVMMMATMKAYFEYEMSKCGIPSVTLEGEKCDWEKILERLDVLETFGDEPKAWAKMLRPILQRFVQAFDGKPDITFWNKVSHHYSLGSGTLYLSGWITAFCVWDSEGQWQGTPRTAPVVRFGQQHFHPRLILDDVQYPAIDTQNIPMGFCQVDVKVIDSEGESDCVMMSGHMACLVEGETGDTVRPLPSWYMFVKPTEDVVMDVEPGGNQSDRQQRTNPSA